MAIDDGLRWLTAIGGVATVVLVGRLTWRGIWHLMMAEWRALNCEKREAVIAEHAERLLRISGGGVRSGTSSPDTMNDS